MSIARNQEASGGGGTLTAAGSVLKLENIATASAGTLTDTVAVLELVQDTDSTGITLSVDSNGANTKPIMALENTAGDIEIFRTDATPESAVTGSIGDLAIDGTGGILYIKNTGSATNTGWEPLSTVDAYSSMWFHGAPTTVTISTQNAFTKMTLFVNVGAEDAGGNVVGDATTDDDFTINLAGTYSIDIEGSFTNSGGGSVEFQMAPKVILNSAKTITNATNVDPIVITSTAHGLKSGDGVIQTGVGGNTAANGDFYITRINDDSYSLQTLAHVNVAGNGAYTSGGTVDAVIPGNIIMERIVSNTALGRGAASGTFVLAVGDVLEAVAVNEDSTDNLAIEQVQFGIRRIGN